MRLAIIAVGHELERIVDFFLRDSLEEKNQLAVVSLKDNGDGAGGGGELRANEMRREHGLYRVKKELGERGVKKN